MNPLVGVPERRADVQEWLRGAHPGERVKENRVRSVYRWRGLYIKRFKYPGLLQRIRGWIHDKARHEFRILGALRRKGLDVPAPVAWARRGGETFLFVEEIEGAQPLGSLPMTRERLQGLAGLVRRLQEAGLRDDDLHLGNVLEAKGRWWLIDLHRAVLTGGLSASDRRRGLAFLLLSLAPRVSRTDAVRFLRFCGAAPRELWPEFQAVRDRYWRGRQARARKTGSGFEVHRGGLVVRRPYTAEAARRALAARPQRVVKDLPRRRLWLADPETFVKEGAPAFWTNGFGLELRGIPTPRLLARQGGRVVGHWVEGARPLADHLKATGRDPELLVRLARTVRRMHDHGVYHRDLKAGNILVRAGELYIVDLDRVAFLREVPCPERLWNLAQLNAAVGPPVTRTDRLRFFLAYAGSTRALRLPWKQWAREIMEKTRARGHVWPAPLGR